MIYTENENFIPIKTRMEIIKKHNLGLDFGRYRLDKIQFVGDPLNDNINTIYSDRMYSWDGKKYNACCMNVFNNKGQWFNQRSKEDIEKFLSLYLKKEVQIFLIASIENRSTGYPTWRFDYCVV